MVAFFMYLAKKIWFGYWNLDIGILFSNNIAAFQ
jgi:hypothetical protein